MDVLQTDTLCGTFLPHDGLNGRWVAALLATEPRVLPGAAGTIVDHGSLE
jgi:hypothetical protein